MDYNYIEDLNNKDCFELLDLCERNLIDLNKEQVNFLVNKIFRNSGFISKLERNTMEQFREHFSETLGQNET